MEINLQPLLENEQIKLLPLENNDLEELYILASNPLVWEQHPNKDRWRREVFEVFFDGAIKSKGAFKVIKKENNQIIGSTRFYDYNSNENIINIGYTFYGNDFWGKGINLQVKKIMLDYIFQYVETVAFHIGSNNIRSQIAISRIGAKLESKQEITYFGEKPNMNNIYILKKEDWGK